MTRILGMFGLAAVFLIATPKLRLDVMSQIDAANTYVVNNSPYSYAVLGLISLLAVMVFIYRAAQPR